MQAALPAYLAIGDVTRRWRQAQHHGRRWRRAPSATCRLWLLMKMRIE